MPQIGIQHDSGLPGCGKWTPLFLPASLWHSMLLMWTVLDSLGLWFPSLFKLVCTRVGIDDVETSGYAEPS